MPIKFTILGCGSSMGVPRADGFWGKCNPSEKKNYRTRCSAMLSNSRLTILFDTSPDIRHQLLREKVKNIDIDSEGEFNTINRRRKKNTSINEKDLDPWI